MSIPPTLEYLAVYEIIWKKCGLAGQATVTVQYSADKMRFACRITKARIQTRVVMVFFSYARQHWSRERDLVFRFTYTASRSIRHNLA